jgi:hypothetical protein
MSDQPTNSAGPSGTSLPGRMSGTAMVTVIVGVDLLFFRNRFWERLAANIGIVLVFAAFYFRFFTHP